MDIRATDGDEVDLERSDGDSVCSRREWVEKGVNNDDSDDSGCNLEQKQ